MPARYQLALTPFHRPSLNWGVAAIKALGAGLKAKSPPGVTAPEGLCLWPVHLE